jgi:DNA-binding response OmpR family regulator
VTKTEECVVVIEDDHHISDLVAMYLRRDGFRVLQAGDAESGLGLIDRERPKLVIVDIGLPGDLDGLDVCRRLRGPGGSGAAAPVPVLILSARDDEVDRVLGLELGADDYVTKPFSMAELEARMRAALRHGVVHDADPPSELVFESLVVDLLHRSATLVGGALRLTAKEFDLLAFLTRHAGQVCTHEMILKGVWGESFGRERQYLHAYVHRLRQKLAGPSGLSIATVPGIGYSLARDADTDACAVADGGGR